MSNSILGCLTHQKTFRINPITQSCHSEGVEVALKNSIFNGNRDIFIFRQGPTVFWSQSYTNFKGFKVYEGFKDFNVPKRCNVVNNHIISIKGKYSTCKIWSYFKFNFGLLNTTNTFLINPIPQSSHFEGVEVASKKFYLH